MDKRLRANIVGTGIGVPRLVRENSYFAEYLDTSDEWITTRTGIKQRYHADEGETTVSLAKSASLMALADAGMKPEEIDCIIFATVTPDTPVPASACWLQAELGMPRGVAFDINAACAGLGYAATVAGSLIDSGTARNVLVVGSETLSRITNMQDRATCVLFGDGASALVMTRCDDPDRGLLYHHMGSDGTCADYIIQPGGGSRLPASQLVLDEKLCTLHMKGREVYKFAVTKFAELCDRMLEETGIRAEDIDLIVPHQSNLRIIESVRVRMNLAPDKIAVNIDRYGNTSSASVGLALHEARQSGKAKEGDLVLLIAFGAGLTWSVLLVRM